MFGVTRGDLHSLLTEYPIKKTGAQSAIAMQLGFRDTRHYEDAVRKLLSDDPSARGWVREQMPRLPKAVDVA